MQTETKNIMKERYFEKYEIPFESTSKKDIALNKLPAIDRLRKTKGSLFVKDLERLKNDDSFTLQRMADIYDISRERIRQLFNMVYNKSITEARNNKTKKSKKETKNILLEMKEKPKDYFEPTIKEEKKDLNKFGMKFMDKGEIDIANLKFNPVYQRKLEPHRWKEVLGSMERTGVFAIESPIVINQNNEIVDGQHRVVAAEKYGFKKVLYVRYYFASEKCEAKYFKHMNKFNSKQKPVDYWFSAKMAGDRLANILYKLDEQDTSSLKNQIALKGKQTNTKLSISQVLSMILYAVDWKRTWSYTTKDEKKINGYLNKYSDDRIIEKVNEYYQWFVTCFNTKPENPFAYNADTFRVILVLFKHLKEMGVEYNQATINKLRKFRFGPEFNSAPGYGKRYQLINFYNKGKTKKNRIPYDVGEN